jgi:hypothetical protein
MNGGRVLAAKAITRSTLSKASPRKNMDKSLHKLIKHPFCVAILSPRPISIVFSAGCAHPRRKLPISWNWSRLRITRMQRETGTYTQRIAAGITVHREET